MMEISKPKNEDEEYLKTLPIGFRFKPKDEELCYYLRSKVQGERLPPNKIKLVHLYDYDPVTLTAMSDNASFNGRIFEWYFFTPRDRKYPKGERPGRRAGNGFWKATGLDSSMTIPKSENISSKIGYKKKTLVYYRGKQPNGVKTNWIMHEYLLENPPARIRTGPDDMRLNDWVLCRLYERQPEKKKLKTETVNPGSLLLVTDQNQKNAENSTASANIEAVSQQYYPTPSFPPLQSQQFPAQDRYLDTTGQQTNSQMADFKTCGLTQYPQPCHDPHLALGNGTTFPSYDPLPDHTNLIPTVPPPMSLIPWNDQLPWVHYDNLNVIHQPPTVPSNGPYHDLPLENAYGFMMPPSYDPLPDYTHSIPATPLPLPSIPLNYQIPWVDSDNLNGIHQKSVGPNYGNLTSTVPPPMSQMPQVDDQAHYVHYGNSVSTMVPSIPPNDQSDWVDIDNYFNNDTPDGNQLW